jgi:hypothetical protein
MLTESQIHIAVMQIKAMNWKCALCMCGGRGILSVLFLILVRMRSRCICTCFVYAFYFPYGNFHFQGVISYSHNLFLNYLARITISAPIFKIFHAMSPIVLLSVPRLVSILNN